MEREARSHGLLVAGLVFVAAPLAAGGWMISFRTGVIMQMNTTGSFCSRLAILIALAIPSAWFIYRRESRRKLAKLTEQTICRKCDAFSQKNEGTACDCGGAFISLRQFKWVEEPQEVG